MEAMKRFSRRRGFWESTTCKDLNLKREPPWSSPQAIAPFGLRFRESTVKRSLYPSRQQHLIKPNSGGRLVNTGACAAKSRISKHPRVNFQRPVVNRAHDFTNLTKFTFVKLVYGCWNDDPRPGRHKTHSPSLSIGEVSYTWSVC